MSACPFCAEEIPGNEAACPHCGSSLIGSSADGRKEKAQRSQPVDTKPLRPATRDPFFYLVVGVLVVGGGVTAWMLTGGLYLFRAPLSSEKVREIAARYPGEKAKMAATPKKDEVQQPGTSLIWLRCAVGQTWNGSACVEDLTNVNWSNAQSACPSGYRLPSRQEYVDLLGDCDGYVRKGEVGSCKMCSEGLPCMKMFTSDENWNWTSSPDGDTSAWTARLSDGSIGSFPVGNGNAIRCVRSVQ